MQNLLSPLPTYPLTLSSSPAQRLLALVPILLGLVASLEWKAVHSQDPFERCMQDPDYEQLLRVVTLGLNRTLVPQRVIVVGAGVAGLVAAKVLSDAGHKVRSAACSLSCFESFLLQWEGHIPVEGWKWRGEGNGELCFLPCSLGVRPETRALP